MTGVYVPVAPHRVLDTRATQRVARGSTVVVDTGLPDAAAVGVQLTAAGPSGPGYLTAWSGQGGRPATSVLNLRRRDDVNSNFVIVPATGGTFTVYASETTDVIVDVMGYASEYAPLTPTRIVDTRLTGGTAARTSVTVRTGLPAGTPAAAVQITVADTAGPGYLTAWSGRGKRPTASVLNYGTDDVDGNFVIVPLAPNGTFKIYTLAAAGIIVDLMGVPDDYTPTEPRRVLDTRLTGGTAAGSVVRVATNLDPTVTAAAVQITATDTAAPGHLIVWDGTGAAPAASALNYGPAAPTDGNFLIVPVRKGAFSILTSAGAGIVVDVMGYTGTARGAGYDVPAPNPATLLPADVTIAAPDVVHPYGPHPLQALDVHRGSTGRTLVWLHGGGWEGGDKDLGTGNVMRTFNRVPRLLRSLGWTVVSANYRLSPEADLDDIVADFYAGLLAVGDHAAEWKVDVDRIVVGGFSAGGHVAALGATAINDGAFQPPPGLPAIRAIVAQDGNLMSSLFGAAVPVGTLDADGNDISPQPAIARLLDCPGGAFGRCSAAAIARSDIVTYSDPDDPPLYLIGGTHSVIPLEVQVQTRDLVRAAGQVVVFDAVDTGPDWARMHDVQGLNWAALSTFLEHVTR